MKRVPLKLGGKAVGYAKVDEERGKVFATVTDSVAAAQLAAMLGRPTHFSIAAGDVVPAADFEEVKTEREKLRSEQREGVAIDIERGRL